MVTDAITDHTLSPVEQTLVDYVVRGELLDLIVKDETANEATMRSWDDSRSCSAAVIRDILRGRHAADPDPHGLRLRGARITGRLDLENLTSSVFLELRDCFLEEGIVARDANLPGVGLVGCLLENPADSPFDAAGLTCKLLKVHMTTITGHSKDVGAVNLIGAHIGLLDCTGATLRNDSGPALDAGIIEVGGSMHLADGFSADGVGQAGAVNLVGAHVTGQLNCTKATLRNNSGPALSGNGIQVGTRLRLVGGFTAVGAGPAGAVSLVGAHIGLFDCTEATLCNDSGPALHANEMQVGESVRLVRVTARGAGPDGAVNLVGAHVTGHLDCTRATLCNGSGPALHANGMQVSENVLLIGGFAAVAAGDGVATDLTGVKVAGTFHLEPAGVKHADSEDRRFALDGLAYPGVPKALSAADWMRLLRSGTPAYAAQPYQQLAAGYRAMGDDRQVRQILMSQRDDQLARQPSRLTERMWGRVTKVTLGYGYEPWRALAFLVAAIALSCALAVVLGSHGALAQSASTSAPARSCTVLERVSVGLDLNLPVNNSLVRARCELTNDSSSVTAAWLAAGDWILQLLAWAFAALFIAGFTSAVRKT